MTICSKDSSKFLFLAEAFFEADDRFVHLSLRISYNETRRIELFLIRFPFFFYFKRSNFADIWDIFGGERRGGYDKASSSKIYSWFRWKWKERGRMGKGNTCARIDWNWNLIFSENEIFARGTYLKYILKQWDRATFPTAYLII